MHLLYSVFLCLLARNNYFPLYIIDIFYTTFMELPLGFLPSLCSAGLYFLKKLNTMTSAPGCGIQCTTQSCSRSVLLMNSNLEKKS